MGDRSVEKKGYRPARGYSWPPFEPGNMAAKTHGARSERIVTPLAAEIANSTLERVDYLQDPTYRESVMSWSRVAARVELLERWVDEHGQLDEAGKPTAAAALLAKLTTQESNLASKLGLDPLSRARLGRDTAAAKVDLAQYLSAQGDGDGGEAS